MTIPMTDLEKEMLLELKECHRWLATIPKSFKRGSDIFEMGTHRAQRVKMLILKCDPQFNEIQNVLVGPDRST